MEMRIKDGCGSRMVFLLSRNHTYGVVNNLSCHSSSLHIALLIVGADFSSLRNLSLPNSQFSGVLPVP